MEMTSLNISLPRSLKEYVENRVREGGYSTPSEYLRTLVREDQKRKAEEKLETLLLEGMASGPAVRATAEYWRQKRRSLPGRQRKKSRR